MKLIGFIFLILFLNIVGGFSSCQLVWEYTYGSGYGLHPLACLGAMVFLVLLSLWGIVHMAE